MHIVYRYEWSLFTPVRAVHFSKFRTEVITLAENSICFLLSTPVPPGLHLWAIELHVSFVSLRIFSLQQPEWGRRGGATPIQRLICLFVKRNSRPHFLMEALIKLRGVGLVWPGSEGRAGGGGGGYCGEEQIRLLPSVAIWGPPIGVKALMTNRNGWIRGVAGWGD